MRMKKEKNNTLKKVMTKPKNKTPFFFDDCEICKALKEADEEGRNLNEEELRQAFKKQEAKKK